MKLTPVNVAILGNELAVSWKDGLETYIHLEHLRRACPCAACGGEPDLMGRVDRPQVSYGEGSFVLKSCQFVGGYAIQPTWADGHNTGLYTFDYLRRLGEGSGPASQIS